MKVLFTFLILVLNPILVSAMDRSAQVDEIREATFRYQFQQNASGSVKVFFLDVLDPASGKYVDPNEAFINRFASNKPRVAKGDESSSARATSRVIDRRTGDEGVLFTVGVIKWVSDNEVTVEGSVYVAGDSGASGIYHLNKRDGKWVVFKYDILSVS